MIRVGFVQFDVRFGDTEWNLGKAADAIPPLDADLVVLPELCTSGYLFTSEQEVADAAESAESGPSVERWRREAARRNVHIVAGIAESADDRIYNSAVLVRPSGEVDIYRKTHLFGREKLWFAPGDTGFNVFEIGDVRVGIMICFDWIFPESCRTLALGGADIICHPANLVLPYCQEAMITRCIENRVFSITANRTGIENRGGHHFDFTGRSRIIGPYGDVLAEGPVRGDSAQVVEIDLNEARNKSLGEFNNLFDDRRPDSYSLHPCAPQAGKAKEV